VPNANDGEFTIGLLIPIEFAILITLSLPTFSDNFTATVLTDFAKASVRETSPIYSFL
jgi:hypothetical protein